MKGEVNIKRTMACESQWSLIYNINLRTIDHTIIIRVLYQKNKGKLKSLLLLLLLASVKKSGIINREENIFSYN